MSSLGDANGKLKQEDDADKWMTVGIFKTLTQNVTQYVDYQWENSIEKLTSDNLPDLALLEKISLEQGRPYRFRIAGVNACGVGKFSEVSSHLFISRIFSKFSPLVAVFIQNLSSRLPWRSVWHQNLKIHRRRSPFVGAAEPEPGRNYRIFSLLGRQGQQPI